MIPWSWTPGQQPRAGTLYEKVEHGNTIDTFVYPHDLQLMTLLSKAPFIFMLIGQQGGKTSWGPPWVFHKMEQYPGMGAMAIGKTRDQLKENVVKKIVEFARGTAFEGTYHKQDHFYESPYGDILLKTAEEPENMQGPHPCCVWGDEPGAWSYEAWVAAMSRVDSAGCQFLGTTTAYFMNWFYYDCYKPWLRGSSDFEFLIGDSLVNPSYSKVMWDMKQRVMTPEQFDMYMRSVFRKESGLVYKDFSREKVAKKFRTTRHPCILALDPGSSDPEAALVMSMDPKTDTVYVYDAYERTDVQQEVHAKELAPRIVKYGILDVAYDPRGLAAKQDLEKELAKLGCGGLNWFPKTVALEQTISETTRLIRTDKLYADHENCEAFFTEAESWKKNEKTGIPEARGPNHTLDAFRYGHAHLKEMKEEGRLLPSGDILMAIDDDEEKPMTHSQRLWERKIARQDAEDDGQPVINWGD